VAKWLTLHPDNPQPRAVAEVVAGLEAGKVIAYPTGHNYALACLHGKSKSMERLYQLRELKADHPMALLCRDIAHVAEYAQIDNSVFRQMKGRAAKAFTYVLPISKRVGRQMLWLRKRHEQGFQLPTTPLTHAIMDQVSSPLVTTSLCVNGSEYLGEAYQIDEEIGGQIDFLLDTGEAGVDASTVVDFCTGAAQVIRQGVEVW
jgi:tRNA threonylcarbamoyl adenosine modification protein (Sua5/YciO/YrdC/YwlC family)